MQGIDLGESELGIKNEYLQTYFRTVPLLEEVLVGHDT